MKQFWLCFFLITSFLLYAEDAVTRATSYGGENISSDSVTSATEYAGMPKTFENNKADKTQPIEAPKKEKVAVKPEVVLPQLTDDESLRVESAMRFLPETFEYIPPAQPETKRIPAEAVPYYQSHAPELVELPLSQELKPTEVSLDDSYRQETKLLPPTYEKEKPTIVLADDTSEKPEESKINSKLQDLPELKEKILAEASLDDSYRQETKLLPPTYEKEKPTIVLADDTSEKPEESEINSKLQDLPELKEKILAEANLDDSYRQETKLLPPTYEKEKPTIVLADDIADTTGENCSKPIDLPLPEAIFEENESDSEELPFIWEEEFPEEEPEEKENYDEDLPLLLDVPDVALGEVENSETVDIPQVNEELPLPEVKSSEAAENDNKPEIEWEYKKDYRKLMDFNDSFAGFPKSAEDVFNSPAQYRYDENGLVVESGRKIDNKTGQELFSEAVKNIKNNKNDNAAKLLKELLHYNFNVPETEYLLALAEFRNKNNDEAMKYLHRSCNKYKDPYLIAKNTELIGEVNFSLGKYQEAYQNFIDSITGVNSKHDAELYNKAGIAALRAGDIEKARNAWKTGKYLGNRDAKRNLLWLDH